MDGLDAIALMYALGVGVWGVARGASWLRRKREERDFVRLFLDMRRRERERRAEAWRGQLH